MKTLFRLCLALVFLMTAILTITPMQAQIATSDDSAAKPDRVWWPLFFQAFQSALTLTGPLRRSARRSNRALTRPRRRSEA